MKPLTILGLLGPTLDIGKDASRWERWRPTVALCQHPDLVVSALELLYQRAGTNLVQTVSQDIRTLSPETEVRSHLVDMKDPWDFEEVYAALLDFARTYAFGTSLRMGPGYFPTVLGSGLVLFGLYLVVAGLRQHEKMEGSNWSLRALIVLPLSLVLFGLLMEHAGFIPALMVLIFGSAAAGTEFKFIEVLLLAVGLTAFAVALFIYGLGLPYPLLTGW